MSAVAEHNDGRGETGAVARQRPAWTDWPAHARRLQPLRRTLRRRRPLAAALCAGLIGALIAALLPVGDAADGAQADGAARLPAALALPPAPDLAPFLTNRRWGVSLLEERRKRREQQDAARATETREPTPAAALQAIGFVGVAVNTAESAVLLTLPEGEVIRRVTGEALADGRVLVAVRDDALVLERANGERETLVLFPVAAGP